MPQEEETHHRHFREMVRHYWKMATAEHPLLNRLNEHGVLRYPALQLAREANTMGTSIDALNWLKLREAVEGIDFRFDPTDSSPPMVCATGEYRPANGRIAFSGVRGVLAKLLTAFVGHPACQVFLWENDEESLEKLRREGGTFFTHHFAEDFPPFQPLRVLHDRFLERIRPLPLNGRHPQKRRQHAPSAELRLEGKIFLDDWLPAIESDLEKCTEEKCGVSPSQNASAISRLWLLRTWCAEHHGNPDRQKAYRWSLLLDAVGNLQEGHWPEWAQNLEQMELPDIGEYKGRLDPLWNRAFFLKLQLLYKLRRKEEFRNLYGDYRLLADSPEGSQRNHLGGLHQLIDPAAQDAQIGNERSRKLTSCLVALDRIQERLCSWRFGEESKAKPLTVELQSDGSIACQESHSFRLDTKEYPDFYKVLCDNQNILHRTTLSAVTAGLAAFAKTIDLLPQQSGEGALHRLRDCFSPVMDTLHNDPFLRHDWLYYQRIHGESPGSTPLWNVFGQSCTKTAPT